VNVSVYEAREHNEVACLDDWRIVAGGVARTNARDLPRGNVNRGWLQLPVDQNASAADDDRAATSRHLGR
jgi:hypothetical protein